MLLPLRVVERLAAEPPVPAGGVALFEQRGDAVLDHARHERAALAFLRVVVFEAHQQVQREFLLNFLAVRRGKSRLADERAGLAADQVVGVFPQLVVRVLVIHFALLPGREGGAWMSARTSGGTDKQKAEAEMESPRSTDLSVRRHPQRPPLGGQSVVW